MGACDRASQWQYALSFLRGFRGRSLQPDVVTYNTALSACSKGSRWQLALALHRAGPGFAAAPALRACSQGQQWQLGLEFLRSLRAEDLDLRALTAGIQACSLGGCWQLALQLLHEMEGLRHSADAIAISAAMGACEKAGHWAQALSLFRGLRGRGLEPDVVSFNSALSSCARGEAWQTALQLLWEACREVRPDVVTFTSAMSAVSRAHLWEQALDLHELLQTEVLANNVVRLTAIQACGMLEHWQMALALLPEDGHDEESGNAANAALAAVGSWAGALHLVASMTISRIPTSSVTFRSLARSCERTGRWQQALSMAQSQRDHHVSLESYKALIAACQASAATTAGAALMREMHGVTETGFTWLWTLAKLQLQEADLRARAVAAAIRALEGTVSPAEIAMVSWSLATLGVASPRYRAACSRQVSSLHRFTTEELGHLAFGLAAAPGDAKVFLQLQREVRGRLKMVRWTQVAAPLRRKALEDDLLNVLWSCSFAGAVDPPLRRALGRCFRALGASLDRRFRNSPTPLHSSQALTGPSVRLDLCDRLVLFKPVGWEVCDGNVRRQLRHFVGWKGSWPILRSAQHDYGFLHRVDVPCSGLILFAKSFRAYYDLQVQLRAGDTQLNISWAFVAVPTVGGRVSTGLLPTPVRRKAIDELVMFLGLSGASPSRKLSFEGVAFASRPAGPTVLFPQKKLQKLRLFRKRKGVVRWAWEFYSAVSDACASLVAGEHGHQQLRGLAEVRSVRQHRRTAFLDVGNAATRNEGSPVSTSEDQELLQVVVPLEADVGNKQLLRPGILLSFRGVAGRTRRGQASLFAKSFTAEGLTAASPALLASLLSFALVGAVRRKDLCRWLQMSEVELENVLLWDEPRRQRFCSRRARFLRFGRDHRARNRRRSMTAKEHHALEELRGWAEMLRRHAKPLPQDVSDVAHAALGPADPLANLGGAHPHLERFSKRKKRPQVSVMTRLVSELGQLRSDVEIVDIVDVGGGRGDLAMAVAAAVPRAKVSVIESFAPSAQQGQHRADELKLDVDFHVSNAESLASALQAQERRPIVMALHACGGLTDVALEACATLRLPFCICPCCYASQPQLRSRALAPQEEILQRLAESNGLPRDVSQLAAFGINGMRLRHLDPIPVPISTTPELPPSWSVRAYTFPNEWSSRNMILWGYPQEWKQSTGFTSLVSLETPMRH
ncbi:unnamed protein product [Symbiodinium sp. CCMP2592]|nr:unnamed protein product [Symbiodinium sp. CCMP2592]